MSAVNADGESERGLVVVALPAVQRFITEARTTGDVAAASGIYSDLAAVVVSTFEADEGSELVLPGSRSKGMPNRIVALVAGNRGAEVARTATDRVHQAWRERVHSTFGEAGHETPGFPVVQWACVPPLPGGYQAQWAEAGRLLAARRRLRDFAPVPSDGWRERALCSLSPRWPAEPGGPPGTPKHERDDKLSTVGWVKRRWSRSTGAERFPSTSSIASAPYRKAVLAHLGDEKVAAAVSALKGAVEMIDRSRETPVAGLDQQDKWIVHSGGPWVYPGRWRVQSLKREADNADPSVVASAAAAGAKASRALQEAMEKHKSALTSYLAVVVQDVDDMGKYLTRTAAGGFRGHQEISRTLLDLSQAQDTLMRSSEILGVRVYAGGDDLLAFTPAATALNAAKRANQEVSESFGDTPVTASTAVLYFHQHSSIQHAMTTARQMLDDAKDTLRFDGKHALAVGFLRRSGTTEMSLQPWGGTGDSDNAADLFGIFAQDAEHRLSPRLVADLERDAGELAPLREQHSAYYQAELIRLVTRHTRDRDRDSARKAAKALGSLGRNERAPDAPLSPHAAAKIGVFLRQEAR